MSRMVAKLEQRVQAQLFYRTTRTVRLTDTGSIFLEHCQRIIMERDEAIALINERGDPLGELRITCSSAMGEWFISPIVQEFARDYPKLSVQLDLTNRVVDLVAEGYDLAIRTGHLADSRLIGTRIASRSLLTCASPDYLIRCGRPRNVTELRDHSCLVGTSAIWHFRGAAGVEELIRPRSTFRCNSGASIASAATAGMGVCQLPGFYVLPRIGRGELEEILEEYAPDDEPIWAVYPQRRHLLPKISLLVDRLRQQLPAATNVE